MARNLSAFAVVLLSLGVLLLAWSAPSAIPAEPAGSIQAWCAPAAEGLARLPACPAHVQSSPPASGVPIVGTSMTAKPSIAQLKARELDLRIGFSTASAILRVAALVAILGSFGMVAKDRLARRTQDPAVRLDGVGLALLAIGLIAGAIAGYVATYGDSLTTLLLNDPIKMTRPQVSADGTSALARASTFNLVAGFAAAGTLLALFAQIARSSEGPAERLQALQFALLMRAALFAASSFANGQVGAWAKGVLDPVAMKDAMSAIDRLIEFWAVLVV